MSEQGTPPEATSEGETPVFRVGILIFDDMTLLDSVGPADIFARVPGVEVVMIGRDERAVVTDSGTLVLPAATIADAPILDVVFVGGGAGVTPLLSDQEVLEFLRERAATAQWVTSVCTGALVLGAAGLLDGYDAATHWTVMHLLPALGARPVERRVVIDRNRITGGGVTAGIDFALRVVARLWGSDLAEMIQLACEYDPEPPFSTGSPRIAPPGLIAQCRQAASELTEKRRIAVELAAGRLYR
ncbi:MAG TPA: DJ-1/PfpI family protein [Jatrophihabitans sp.]|jgi:cyclohexyl-isocyanide hydratase